MLVREWALAKKKSRQTAKESRNNNMLLIHHHNIATRKINIYRSPHHCHIMKTTRKICIYIHWLL
jgi:hypothetical protein